MSSARQEQTELLVVGGGPGGYVAAIRAAKHGIDVTLADAEGVGGTCLNHGCIPSKALISATDRIHDAGTATDMGIYGDPYVDVAELAEWKDSVVDKLTSGVEGLCRRNGVTLVDGYVTFEDAENARVAGQGETWSIEFEKTIIATGSRPLSMDGFDVNDGPILDSRQALALTSAPDSIVVVGAGYIGMELGTVFHKLGTDVTVVEMLDRALPGYDSDLASVVEERATDLGIDLQFGQAANRWDHDEEGVRLVTVDEDNTEYTYDCETVLVAVGREPATDSVGLDALGVELTDDGFVETNEKGETSQEGVYAVGDVAGEPMLAHKASMEGRVAADAIAGLNTTTESRVIPAVVFTDPEIARVGLTDDEAEDRGLDPVVGRFPLSSNGRALTLGADTGFVRLLAAGESGRLIGASVVGPEASELIGELTLAVQQELTLDDIAETVHAHPTLSEMIMEGAAEGLGNSIHWSGS